MSSHSSSPLHAGLSATQGKRSSEHANLDSNSQQAAKKKRPQSCDTCRSRKIKCVRLQVDGLDNSGDDRCVQCRAIDAKCTFDYIPKRPGPQSSFAKTARKEAEAHAQAQAQAKAAGPSHSRASTSGLADNTPGAHSAGGQHHASAGSPTDDTWYRTLTGQNFAAGGGSGSNTRSSSWSGATNFDAYLNNQMLTMTPSNFAGMPGASPFDLSSHSLVHLSGPSPSMSISAGSSATPGSYAGSTPWQGPPRSEAGSSRSAPPLAPIPHAAQSHSNPHQPSSNPSHLDEMHFSDIASGLAGGSSDARSTPLPPLPIPSFSRVQSPVLSNEQARPQAQQIQSQHQELSFGASHSAPPITASNRVDRVSPKLSTTYCSPVLRPKSLEDIAPRQTFLSIVSLYFHYLWPLLPIVHRPTFSHDLLNRRDERDEAFLAFVLSLTSYTLIQCPRTAIPAPWTVYRKLHRICHLTSRRMQPRVYDPPQLLHVNTLYCDHIYLGTVGKTNAANAVLAEAVRVAYTLGLHDERKNDAARNVAPYGLDASSFAHYKAPQSSAVEKELRKRMFWVLHGSSTTIAMLQDEPALIHAIDACVDLPLAVDEEGLGNVGYVQRGSSVLCGFLTVTRLHQVMLELLESYRRDRRFPIDDVDVARSRSRYLADVLRRVQQAIDDMPEELRKPVYTHSPPEAIRRPGSNLPALEQQNASAPLLQAIGFDTATQTALGNHLSGSSAWPWPAETASSSSSPRHSNSRQQTSLTSIDIISLFRPSPPPPPSSISPSSSPVLSPMCTLHANIVTTESLIRFLVLEYRQLLSSLFPSLPFSESQGWQAAAETLLGTFNDLPLDALASNGASLIAKIVYVVSALLERARRSDGAKGSGWGYMSSLLATLTRLSQTRGDEHELEHEEMEAEVEGGNDDAAPGSGRRDGNGNGNGSARDNGHNDSDPHSRPPPPRRDGSTGGGSGNGGRGNIDAHPPAAHLGDDQVARRHHRDHADSPVFSNHTPTTSATSSAANTASTTPTSEPTQSFFEKMQMHPKPAQFKQHHQSQPQQGVVTTNTVRA